jgi:hypothetical protein
VEVEPFNAPIDFCVLIPVYNNEAGLNLSLESIHYPSGAFLVVIVDDGSLKPVTLESLSPQWRELPLQIIRSPVNNGITHALNTGLKWISTHTQARYIARLDCSDRCAFDRFVEQVGFLDAYPAVGLLGSWCRFEDRDTGRAFTYTTPLEDAPIRKAMHLRNVFIHPTVMFRTALVQQAGLYPLDYPHAEDYALFWRMLQLADGAIIGRPLLTAALNSKGISASNRRTQLNSCQKVIAQFGGSAHLKRLGIALTWLRLWLPQGLILRLKTWKEDR